MPRFYSDTFDHFACPDGEGQDLPDLAAVRREAQRSLFAIMHDHRGDERSAQYRAEVRDGKGKLVLTMTLQMTVEEADWD